MIVVVDFGSQTAHLISRRIREFGIQTTFLPPKQAVQFIKKNPTASSGQVRGIILSGGPSSVYEKKAPTINREVFDFGIPILAICYGFQLVSHFLGGKVSGRGSKEYGPATLVLSSKYHGLSITKGLPKTFTVWMSHGDDIVALPQGFAVAGKTEHVPFAMAVDEKRQIYGLLFHPEVDHTEHGTEILENFIKICGLEKRQQIHDIQKLEHDIKEKVGDAYVIGAISGGADSTVAGVLTAQAIGNKFIPIYVDNGLMREGTAEHVKKIFIKFGITPDIVKCQDEMLAKLKGIIDPEKKRKIIGGFYIAVFEREMERLIKEGKDVKFLMQGTIYSDVIESKGTRHAQKIKSHHNVGGLPKQMKLQLLEPLRMFYKDEVREIGESLGLSEDFVWKQPFPGPGFAVRIRGEMTAARLEKERIADSIVLEEMEKAKLLRSVFLSFPVMTGALSTAVKGDGRFFGEVIALRVVESTDVMTSTWAKLPYEVLQKISSRIVNEVPGISRVVYDISTKPPATMEWE